MATEQRLIDANKIPWEEWYVPDPESEEQWDFKAELGVLKPAIDKMPTVDAVEVVRCKDCKHCTVTSDGMVCECVLPTKRMEDYYIYGSTILARVEPEDFCSRGNRKEK